MSIEVREYVPIKNNLASTDYVIIEDSQDKKSKKKVILTEFAATQLDINGLAQKNSPAYVDEFVIADSTDSFKLKKTPLSEIKTIIKPPKLIRVGTGVDFDYPSTPIGFQDALNASSDGDIIFLYENISAPTSNYSINKNLTIKAVDYVYSGEIALNITQKTIFLNGQDIIIGATNTVSFEGIIFSADNGVSYIRGSGISPNGVIFNGCTFIDENNELGDMRIGVISATYVNSYFYSTKIDVRYSGVTVDTTHYFKGCEFENYGITVFISSSLGTSSTVLTFENHYFFHLGTNSPMIDSTNMNNVSIVMLGFNRLARTVAPDFGSAYQNNFNGFYGIIDNTINPNRNDLFLLEGTTLTKFPKLLTTIVGNDSNNIDGLTVSAIRNELTITSDNLAASLKGTASINGNTLGKLENRLPILDVDISFTPPIAPSNIHPSLIFDFTNLSSLSLEYTIKNDTTSNIRKGYLHILTDGTTPYIRDDSFEIPSLPVPVIFSVVQSLDIITLQCSVSIGIDQYTGRFYNIKPIQIETTTGGGK